MHIKDRSFQSRDAGAASGLEALMKSVSETSSSRGHPPVEAWNPPYCGEIGLKIARDGTWFYQGSPIGRKRLVALFSSVLRKDEDGKTYLVTPVEKIGIDVEDAPFLAVEMAVTGEGREQSLTFRTNVDDVVTVSATNPLRFSVPGGGELAEQGPKPYVLVRGRLEALVTRSLYYDLIELATFENFSDGEQFGLWSGGKFFAITDQYDPS